MFCKSRNEIIPAFLYYLRNNNMETIAIMGAMPEEIALLAADMQHVTIHEIAGRIYHEGILYNKKVITVFSRMGKVASAATAATLLSHFGVNQIIFTGVAGAIDLQLNVGDVVISTQLVQHDMDASALPIYRLFEIPLLGITHFLADSNLVDKAFLSANRYLSTSFLSETKLEHRVQLGILQPKVYQGIIASGDRFVAHPSEVATLRRTIPGVLCVEMEGAAVAQVCYEHKVPFVVCRVMSDRADHGAPVDFQDFVTKVASPLTRGMVRELIQFL